ncbi:alpha/beta fold hydrolase [Piscinibacter sp. HJYY11]|uniref:alpha/beta fold hydrolase n=1 Tax=Piscinibacter sp. HJYY11 TaxID=2801333 RepID=UPI00191F1403|nr:alpha/beta fold hydrolase [Piscinibacter sp. HJYY11]MBL0729005.1 alpha/beta fold hydrolase [Piscinibacter sp. HJYY11]
MSTPTVAASNPAASFYASLGARSLGFALRLSQSVAPAAATRLALRLFFTPMPLKLAARRRPLPAGWQVEHWPFEQGAMAVYRRVPKEGEGERPTVLLVHGWAGSAQQMLTLADVLHADGFAPVMLDFPAHGRSAGWRATLPQFVRALWAASARLGPLHGVVAHSLGALATAHAAANGLPVQRLALLAASPPPSLFLQWFARSLSLGDSLPQRMGAVIERVEGVPLVRFDPGWLGPRLQQPTLFVHDEDDRVSPLAVGQRLAQAVPGSTLVTTRTLGHRRVLADAAVAQAVTAHLRAGRDGAERPNGSEM